MLGQQVLRVGIADISGIVNIADIVDIADIVTDIADIITDIAGIADRVLRTLRWKQVGAYKVLRGCPMTFTVIYSNLPPLLYFTKSTKSY